MMQPVSAADGKSYPAPDSQQGLPAFRITLHDMHGPRRRCRAVYQLASCNELSNMSMRILEKI